MTAPILTKPGVSGSVVSDSPRVNVASSPFSAKCDGATDDRAAWVAAIASLPKLSTNLAGSGGIIEMPEGVSMISGTIDLPTNVLLQGQGGSASSIKLLPNSNCHIVTTHRSTDGATDPDGFWVGVRDIMLDGNYFNQGHTLADCTLVPGTSTVTSAAGSFQANGTYIMAIGILPGTTIVSGGGTGSIVISQPIQIAALQEAPGAGNVYQGGTVDGLGAPVPWCGIYCEVNPQFTGNASDHQEEPSNIFSDLRIYHVYGDAVKVHGRSDCTLRRIKASFCIGNSFAVDVDTTIDECWSEFPLQCGLLLPQHVGDRVTATKLYNSYGHGVWCQGGNGEISMAGIDLQDSSLDNLRLDNQPGVTFHGTMKSAGWSQTAGAMPSQTTWAASTVYSNFRTGTPSVVVPTVPNGFVYACYVAGTSAGSEPTWPTTAGNTVTDGGATWVCLANFPAGISLNNSSNNVIHAAVRNHLNALRVTGGSTQNEIAITNYLQAVGSADVSSDSVALIASGNRVAINGKSVTDTLALLNDAGLTSTGYSTAVLATSGLQSYWKLAEATGSTATDQKAAANGTYSGSVTLAQPGLIQLDPDTAAVFAGGKVAAGVVYGFPGTAAFSIEAWIKGTAADANARRIVSVENSGNVGWALAYQASTGQVLFTRGDATTFDQIIRTGLTAGQLMHIIATYDGTNLRIYINGALAGSVLASSRSLPAVTQQFTIGAKSYTTDANTAFTGTIEKVAVYNAALSQAQVTALSNAGNGGSFAAADGSVLVYSASKGKWVNTTRLPNRVVAVTQSATPAINTDNTDVASITALAQAITSMTSGLTGTPVDGDGLLVRITDNGTARAIAWGASFEASTVALPTTTVISTMLAVSFIWNAATSKWRCVGVA